MVAALVVAAAVLQSQFLELSAARRVESGSTAASVSGHFDDRAVLPHKPGQTSDSRSRWEPVPGVVSVREPEGLAPVCRRVACVGVRRSDAVSASDRSRLCCWLL